MTNLAAESSIDARLSALTDPQRRIILVVLDEERRSLTLRDLMTAIIKHNHHIPLSEASDEEIRRVQLRLHHTHLPKMEAAGLIEYDADRRLVTPTEQFDEIAPFLAWIDDQQNEWSEEWS